MVQKFKVGALYNESVIHGHKVDSIRIMEDVIMIMRYNRITHK